MAGPGELEREHEDSADCWCGPFGLDVCSECDGAGDECWKCDGQGVHPAACAAFADIYVHIDWATLTRGRQA